MSYACMLWFNFILVLNESESSFNEHLYLQPPCFNSLQTLYFHIPITGWAHSHEWPQTLSGFTSSILALLLNYGKQTPEINLKLIF